MKSVRSLSIISVAVVAIAATSMATIQNGTRLGLTGAQAAEEVTAESIAKALKQRKTRGIKPEQPEQSREARQAIEDLKRIRKTRGWNMHDRVRLSKATEPLAQIDLEIFFAFDSAEISPQAVPVLNKLGEALTQAETKGQTYLLAGHTDAKGTPTYNQQLSEKRAEAVKRYIAQKFRIAPDELYTVGYGFEQLKDRNDPMGGSNRRVQIVNFSQ